MSVSALVLAKSLIYMVGDASFNGYEIATLQILFDLCARDFDDIPVPIKFTDDEPSKFV